MSWLKGRVTRASWPDDMDPRDAGAKPVVTVEFPPRSPRPAFGLGSEVVVVAGDPPEGELDDRAMLAISAALTCLRDAQLHRSERDRALVITHLEDALLRLAHGTPSDLP